MAACREGRAPASTQLSRALGGDPLLLCFFAVTLNLCRAWQMLYFWSWL